MSDQELVQILDRIRQLEETLHAQAAQSNELANELTRAALLSRLADTDRRIADPKRLTCAYAQVYSQNGEDGFIAEIFARIGARSRTFLEIGIGNGLENTTRFLLEQGWTGTWVEGDEKQADEARRLFSPFIETGALRIIHSLVTVDNINCVLDDAGIGMELDYISVDVDQNTSHVWRALNRRARSCCIEYNASIPPSAPLEVSYDPDGTWDGTNHFGAGLKVMELIGKTKRMNLVGCDVQGVNGYFVAEADTADRFCAPFTAENHYQLPIYAGLTHIGHRASSMARRWQVADEVVPESAPVE